MLLCAPHNSLNEILCMTSFLRVTPVNLASENLSKSPSQGKHRFPLTPVSRLRSDI